MAAYYYFVGATNTSFLAQCVQGQRLDTPQHGVNIVRGEKLVNL